MIKGLIFRIIMLMLISAGIMSYVASLNGVDIRQFAPTFERPQLPNLKLPPIPSLKLPGGSEPNKPTSTLRKVYKWRGDDGSWHFSENVPEGVTTQQAIFLNADTNLIQGLPSADKVSKVVAPSNNQAASQATKPLSLNPYSTSAIEKIFDDARGVQKIMDQRKLDLEQATRGQ